jgi:hypothetical protein
MSIQDTTHRFSAWRDRMQMWWITVAVFAIVIAFADGFWVTSLQGTVGAIERRESPFHRWLRDSALMVPLFFLAVLAALLMARRVVGGRRGVVKFATTALLITVLGSGVAIAEMGASSAYDYHLQTSHLQTEQQLHQTHLAVATSGTTTQPVSGACTGTCASERDTFNVHVRAVLYGSLAVLMTNLVLVIWVMALRSERLWRRPVRNQMTTPAMVPQELSLV